MNKAKKKTPDVVKRLCYKHFPTYKRPSHAKRYHTTQHSVVFKDLFGKPVVARFDQPDSSSDGGALLLKACDERLGLSEALAECLRDPRQQSKVAHSFHDLVRQRMFGIACGYEDCNDAARVWPPGTTGAGRRRASGTKKHQNHHLCSQCNTLPRVGATVDLFCAKISA